MVREKREKKPSRLDHKRPSKYPISDPQISGKPFLRKGKMTPRWRTCGISLDKGFLFLEKPEGWELSPSFGVQKEGLPNQGDPKLYQAPG